MEARLEKKRKADPIAALSDRIALNVGGQRFETTRTTLLALPDSMLSRRFSEDNGATNVADKNGEYFFDRSPDSFKAILECYRRARKPRVDSPPLGIDQEDWTEDLLFWGLAEIAAPLTVLEELEAQRHQNRIRFCTLVYEEMWNYAAMQYFFQAENRPDGMTMELSHVMDDSESHGETQIPIQPVPPKDMNDWDVMLYTNLRYWVDAFVWSHDVRGIPEGGKIERYESGDKDADDLGAQHYREIWKKLGVIITVKDTVKISEFSDYPVAFTYPMKLWFKRKEPRNFDSRKDEHRLMQISITFVQPE